MTGFYTWLVALTPAFVIGVVFPDVMKLIGIERMSQTLRPPQPLLMMLILLPWLALTALWSAFMLNTITQPPLGEVVIVHILGMEVAIIALVAGFVAREYLLPLLRRGSYLFCIIVARVIRPA